MRSMFANLPTFIHHVLRRLTTSSMLLCSCGLMQSELFRIVVQACTRATRPRKSRGGGMPARDRDCAGEGRDCEVLWYCKSSWTVVEGIGALFLLFAGILAGSNGNPLVTAGRHARTLCCSLLAGVTGSSATALSSPAAEQQCLEKSSLHSYLCSG